MPRTSEINTERIAHIETMAEEGRITSRMVAQELGIETSRANELLMRMVKWELLSLDESKVIDGQLQKTYTAFHHKPVQTSMFNSFPKRDAWVKAIFGNENRDSEAAWLFT